MCFPFIRRLSLAMTIVAAMGVAACTAPPKAPAATSAVPASPPPPPPPPAPAITPVEAEPVAPATQPALAFSQYGQGPVVAMLAYADKVRPLSPPELAAELGRLGDLVETPITQTQMALVLAQTRNPADLARALGLLQRVISNPSAEALPLQPLARTLAARFTEQRRVEDDRDRQAQQLKDSQRRIDQLNDRLEAVRAIERSFARPNSTPPPVAAPKPAP